jgi:hypothetical protein
VDFWDLTKLLFRRWYFMVPMLLVSIVVAAYVASTVKPDFVVKAKIVLIPPIISEEDSKSGVTNQWLNLGLGPLAEAALVTLQGKSVIEDLEDRGLSTNFTPTKEQYGSLLTVEIIAESEQQGIQTAERIAELYDERITALQKQRGVIDRALITTERLDLGDNLSTSSSKLKRALVAILGAGILLTVAVTIGLDAYLRRRARRRTQGEQEEQVTATLPTPVAPLPRNGNRPPTGSLTFRPITSTDEPSMRVPEPATGSETKRGTAAIPQALVSVEYRSSSSDRNDDAGNGRPEPSRDEPTSLIEAVNLDDEPTAAIAPEDATIVLPLSHNRWAARDGSSKRR